jgi:uncharacterized membrane protein
MPPPEMLREYGEVYQDAPRIILQSFEAQGVHRRRIEDYAVKSASRRSYAGLIVGFVVAMAFLIASFLLIMAGHGWEGTVLGTIDIVGLVAVFVYGSQVTRAERERKTEIMSRAARGDEQNPADA